MLIGFKRIKIQPMDSAGIPEGEMIIVEGNENKGASQEATISGISSEPVKVWGSDAAYFVSQKGTGDIKVALTLLDLPVEEEARILGYTTDEELGAQLLGEDTEPPYCAVALESSDAQGNSALLGFFKGKFSKGDVALKTTEGSSYTPSGDSFTFSAVASDRADKSRGNTMVKFIGPSEKKKAVEDLVFRTAEPGRSADGKNISKTEK